MRKILFFFITLPLVFHSFFLSAQDIHPENLKKHVYILASDSLMGRGFGSEEGKKAAEYIVDQFREAGIRPYLNDYYHEFTQRTGVLNVSGRNIIGIVEGSDPVLKKEYIILGAHYDHLGWEVENGDTLIYNGADDNASGIAGIIEIGRYLSENRDKLKRSILLMAFDGEESGLNGSRKVMADSLFDPSAVKLMFSLDMIGMYSAHNGLDLEGIKIIKKIQPVIEEASKESPIIINKTNANLVLNTDTKSFGDKGIPAVHVFTGLESPYHKPEDEAELIDYEGMAIVCNFMSIFTEKLSVEDELTASQGIADPAKSIYSMKRLNAGVLLKTGRSWYDYPDEFYESKPVFSAGTGLFLEARLSQWLCLKPEIWYDLEGGQQDAGKLYVHSLTTPLSILITTPDPHSYGFRGFFQAGGYYSYSFAGKTGGQSLDFSSEYRDQQYGLILGGGLDIMNVRISFISKSGLVNFMQDGNPSDLRLRSSSVQLGWVF